MSPSSGVDGLVSVALCTFNGQQHLCAQLESVLNQRGVALEVVVCDDASDDDTWPLIEQWAARDNRIRAWRHPHRLGINRNFELALSRCRGEFIALCDQDDVWDPVKLSTTLPLLNHHLLGYCDSQFVDEQGNCLGMRLSQRVNMYEGSGVLPLCFWNSVSGHAMVFRRTLLDHAMPFSESGYHDWWLAAVAATVGSIGYVDQALVQYRQHALSQTDAMQRKAVKRNSWVLFRHRAAWLQRLAQVPGPDQPYLERLSHLWAAREHQWFCPALVRHMRQRSDELMQLNPREPFSRFALKQFWGQRWRRHA